MSSGAAGPHPTARVIPRRNKHTRLNPFFTTPLMSLEPTVAAVAGLVFLLEQLTLMQWLALVFVSTASAGAAPTARRVPPPVEA